MRSQLTTVVLLAAIGSGSMYAAEKTRKAVYVSDVYLSNRDGSSELLGPGKSGGFRHIRENRHSSALARGRTA
jgi:hypothetical protein